MNPGDIFRIAGSRHVYRVVHLLADDTQVWAKEVETGRTRCFYTDECLLSDRLDDRLKAGRI